MKYSFRIIHDATTKSEAKVDFVLKNKIRVWKPARSKELITIQWQLCLAEINNDKASGLQLDQIGCSCAAIYNEQKAKADELGWWRLVV